VHVVFSTRNRAKMIPFDRQQDLWRYMGGISKNLKVNLLAIGGMPDHIHMLRALPGLLGYSNAIQKMKGSSSEWMGEVFQDPRILSWAITCRASGT